MFQTTNEFLNEWINVNPSNWLGMTQKTLQKATAQLPHLGDPPSSR